MSQHMTETRVCALQQVLRALLGSYRSGVERTRRIICLHSGRRSSQSAKMSRFAAISTVHELHLKMPQQSTKKVYTSSKSWQTFFSQHIRRTVQSFSKFWSYINSQRAYQGTLKQQNRLFLAVMALLSHFRGAVSDKTHSPVTTATPDDIYNVYQVRKHEKRIFPQVFSDI